MNYQIGACKVIRIVSDNPEHVGGFIEINTEDFDESKHELFTGDYVAETPQNVIVDPIVATNNPHTPDPEIAQVPPQQAPETGGWGDLGNKPVVPEAEVVAPAPVAEKPAKGK